MTVRAKFMCNMWRIRAKEEEVKVMAIERKRERRGGEWGERGKRKKRKRSSEGNHGTTHNGIMPTTRVVRAEKTRAEILQLSRFMRR